MKLLIGVPALDYIHAEFVKCLSDLLIRLSRDGVDFRLFICNGTLVHIARDKIACEAINNGYSHVLWLDADMIFQPGIVEDLSFCGRDFVTGIAHSRRKPYASCLFRAIEDISHIDRYEGQYPAEPFEVAGCGFACVLISTDILRAVQERYKTCFLPMAEWGEDLAFCKRARSLGYRIFADPCVRLGHIGHDVIYPEDHERYLKEVGANA